MCDFSLLRHKSIKIFALKSLKALNIMLLKMYVLDIYMRNIKGNYCACLM